MGNVRSAPVPRTERAAAWGDVRSLGKMWQYHTLLDISPDGKYLLLGGRSTILIVYDLTAGKAIHDVRTSESVHDAAFSPDGKLVAVAEWRDGFKLRDAATMRVLKTLVGSRRLAASHVRFNHDGSRLLCSSWWGEEIQRWSYDFQQQKEIDWPAEKRVNTDTMSVGAGLRGWGNHLLWTETIATRVETSATRSG